VRNDAVLSQAVPPSGHESVPTVSVIIPCREEQAHIGACLRSVLANDYPQDRIEILVVDGMSRDGTPAIVAEVAQEHATVKLLENPQRTVPAALNRGLREARGEIIMRMDAHALYPRDYISGLVAWLLSSGADNVGGVCVTVPANRTATARAIALALSHPFGVGDAQHRVGVQEARWVDTVPFGCYRRSSFDRVGGFDEELVRNQDVEFNHRLIRRGGRVLLVPGIKSYYYARGSLRQLARMYYQYGRFTPLVVRKVGRIMTWRQFVPPLFVGALGVTAVTAPWVPAMWGLGVLVAGSYALVNLVVSARLGLKHGWRVGLMLPAVFATLHMACGTGVLRGCVDSLVRRVTPRDAPLSR
jgi:glycosyltransferase involved in cell wall biosynthesis